MTIHQLPTSANVVSLNMRLGKVSRPPEPVKKRPPLTWIRPDQNEHVKAWLAWRTICDDYATVEDFISAACFFAGITVDEVRENRGLHERVQIRYKVIRATASRFPKLSSTKLGKHFNKDHTVILYCLNRRGIRGWKHKAKVNADQVVEIRSRVAAGEMQKDIAKDYGVGQSTISAIISGKTWRDVQ